MVVNKTHTDLLKAFDPLFRGMGILIKITRTYHVF